MPSLEIVVSPHRLQVDAPGGWWEDFTGDPVVFNIADVFLQIFRGSQVFARPRISSCLSEAKIKWRRPRT